MVNNRWDTTYKRIYIEIDTTKMSFDELPQRWFLELSNCPYVSMYASLQESLICVVVRKYYLNYWIAEADTISFINGIGGTCRSKRSHWGKNQGWHANGMIYILYSIPLALYDIWPAEIYPCLWNFPVLLWSNTPPRQFTDFCSFPCIPNREEQNRMV